MATGDPHGILYRGPDVINAALTPIKPSAKVERYRAGELPKFDESTQLGESDEEDWEEENTNVTDSYEPSEIEKRRLERLKGQSAPVEHRYETIVLPGHNEEKSTVSYNEDEAEQSECSEDDYYDIPDRQARCLGATEGHQSNVDESHSFFSEESDDDLLTNIEKSKHYEDDCRKDSGYVEKPQYVAKNARNAKRLDIDEDTQASVVLQQKKQSSDHLRHEAREILAKKLLEEESSGVNIEGDDDDKSIPDEQEWIESEELLLWQGRESARIVRDYQERNKLRELKEFVEERRNMTVEERLEHNKILDSQHKTVERKFKPAFMQKWYHPGAFFQDEKQTEDDIYLRDFNEPTAEDKIDRSKLPRPLQVRRGDFGKKGRGKHTHLVDVDTTDFTSPWVQSNVVKRPKPPKGAMTLEEDKIAPANKPKRYKNTK